MDEKFHLHSGVKLKDAFFVQETAVIDGGVSPAAPARKSGTSPTCHPVHGSTAIATLVKQHTLVKHGATIGANATIICGVTPGRYCLVGAGAVIPRDVPDHALVVGNPARQIGWVCECGEKLAGKFSCSVCGKSYRTVSNGLQPKTPT
jgi:acetyltransferase-like isoleucine patch superfamily enzyme